MGNFRKGLYCWSWPLRHLIREKRQTLTALAVMSLSFLVLEIFLLLSSNLQNLLDQWVGQLKLIVYLNDSLSHKELNAIEKKLRQSIDCQELQYFSKEQAWKEFKQKLKVDELLTGTDHNLLPESFIIKLREPLSSEKVIKETIRELQQISGVEEVDYGGIGSENGRELLPLFRSTIFIIGIVLSLAILTIVASILKSSLRSWEIKLDLLQLSGVSPWLIRTPVILAGSIQGLLSVCLSMGILFLLYKSLLFYFYYWEKGSYDLLASIPVSFLSPEMSYGLLAGGTLLGSWSSWLFLQKIDLKD